MIESINKEQIEKAAWDYSDSQRLSTDDDRATAYAKGFKAGARFALASQWMSVEERLPEEGTIVTAHSPNGRIDVLKYHDGEFVDELGQAHCVDYFIPIPPLNPEHPDNPE